MSLERDLAELEASDPAVREAAERLDQTVASIVGRVGPRSAAVILELRRAWLDSGVTLRELGQRTGGHAPQNISAWLNGTYDIRLSRLIVLADALGYAVTLSKRDPS